MIPKIVPGRRDGKSSFKQLAKYVTEGIEQSGEPPEKYSWANLTQYITKESVLNALGENVEKTIGVEIGNVTSLANAPAEMYAVAQRADGRVKETVYHYILSWPEHERPKTEDIFAAARDTLAALGMSEHQYIIAIHANTDNLHAHIEVNRVHPKTFTTADTYRDYLKLHRAAREAEIKYGWHHDNGIFQVVEVNGKKHIVRNDDYVDPDLVPTRPGASRAEVWSGEESLETWCKREPATDLKAVLKDKATSSWQDVHRALARHGLELRDAGGGGFKVADVSDDTPEKLGKPLTVSASAAFRFMKRADLEARFGPYVPRAPDLDIGPTTRSYKRDPHKRLESRLARKELRDDLHARFQKEERTARSRQSEAKILLEPFAAEDRRRHNELRDSHRAKREAIRQDATLTPSQKQQAYMLAKITVMRSRNQLVQQITEERKVRATLLPPIPTWREWVAQQAQLGDEAAISALRGMVYQEGRDGKKRKAREEIEDEENAIRPAIPADLDPQPHNMANLIWKVTNNGRINYSFNDGQPAFRDDGERITFGRKAVSNDALALALAYSADRWKDGIRITGGDFAFKERMVRMAVEQGIAIKNRELRDLQGQVQAELDAKNAIERHSRNSARQALATPASVSARDGDIEAFLRDQDRTAQFSHAITQDKRYTGPVVAQNGRFIAQQLGEHRYVFHERSAFSNPPEEGQRVTIRYQSGKATVQTPKTKSDRGSR